MEVKQILTMKLQQFVFVPKEYLRNTMKQRFKIELLTVSAIAK